MRKNTKGKDIYDLLGLNLEDLDGNKFIYGCFQENDRSRKVCLALGFKYMCTQEKVRERDQCKHKTDYYSFTRQMYEEEIKSSKND